MDDFYYITYVKFKERNNTMDLSPKDLAKLQSVKEEIEVKEMEEQMNITRAIEENYKKTHIFSSYEGALDWLIANQGRMIQWHILRLEWDGKKFKGDNCISYTKEELLGMIEDHIEEINEKYPEEKGKEWWLDEHGKLAYVNL